MRRLYYTILILNLLDLLTTHLAVNVYQIATEANCLMAPIVGHWVIVPIKTVGIGAVLWLLWRRRHYKITRAGVVMLAAFYALVVANNLLILAGVF